MDGGITPLTLYEFISYSAKEPLEAHTGYIFMLRNDDYIPLDVYSSRRSSSISSNNDKCQNYNKNNELIIWEP